MTAFSTGTDARLDVGRVLDDSVKVLAARWRALLPITLLLSGLPTLISGSLQLAMKGNSGVAAIVGIFGIVCIAPTFILVGALSYAMLQALEGYQASARDSLRIGNKTWLSLFGLALSVYVPSVIAMILFVVPGVILLIRWSMATPILVNEGRNVQISMQRSAAMTKGRRWAVFLVYLVLWISFIVLDLVLEAICGGFSSASRIAPLNVLLVTPALSVVFSFASAAVTSSLFHHLRLQREGGAPETLAQVFA